MVLDCRCVCVRISCGHRLQGPNVQPGTIQPIHEEITLDLRLENEGRLPCQPIRVIGFVDAHIKSVFGMLRNDEALPERGPLAC